MTRVLQTRYPQFAQVDYRKVALAAVLPDLIDKPLAMFVFPELKAGLLFAHAPVLHLLALWLTRKRPTLFAYALALFSYILGDRIWYFVDTFLSPFRACAF